MTSALTYQITPRHKSSERKRTGVIFCIIANTQFRSQFKVTLTWTTIIARCIRGILCYSQNTVSQTSGEALTGKRFCSKLQRLNGLFVGYRVWFHRTLWLGEFIQILYCDPHDRKNRGIFFGGFEVSGFSDNTLSTHF